MDFFNCNFDGFSENYFGFQGVIKNGSSSSSSLILDDERGEIVRAFMNKPGQKAAEKALIALRNHSEAERRRRERINGHLATLRTLIPGTNKMDKAALLAEVITQVKELKLRVAEATNGTVLIPTDTDELKVEQEQEQEQDQDPNNINGASISIRATLCCDFKHELLSDLREALESLPLTIVRAEIATLGDRMVNVFVICGSNNIKDDDSDLANSVKQALRSVLDKFYASEEFSNSRNATSGKRRRVAFFSSSSDIPSSLGDIW